MMMPAEEEREELFVRLDTNGSGNLSLADMDRGAKDGVLGKALGLDAGKHLNRNVLTRAFRAADSSENGIIEPAEFFKLLQFIEVFLGMWELFSSFDANSDHRLDQDEFAKGCATLWRRPQNSKI